MDCSLPLDMLKALLLGLLRCVVALLGLGLAVWCAGVVYYMIPGGNMLVWLFLGDLLILVCLWKKWRFAKRVFWGTLAVLLAFYWAFPATNNKQWQTPWAKLPVVTWTNPDVARVENIRDFVYRSTDDYVVRYKTETYDVNQVRTLDFAVCHWDGMELVAHTMLSFGFNDGRYLAISAETRLPEGVKQGSIPGLFKQFNLMYIPATERDIFALRTNYRKEDLYLYRLNLSPQQLKPILVEFLKLLQEQNVSPRFYNTVTNNCTTSLLPPFRNTLKRSRLDHSPLMNGLCDRQAFEAGSLMHQPGETFEELKARSFVPYGRTNDDLSDYSSEIRKETGILW